MTKTATFMALAVVTIVVVVAATLHSWKPTEAYDVIECAYENEYRFVKWNGDSTTYDVTHGNFPQWWQTEIKEAAEIWNDDGGADFSFSHSSSSSYDWGKRRLRKIYRVAETGYLETNCFLTDVDTYFNTRYRFNVCDTDPGDCNESGVYDVKAVSVHEFGHWLVLGHTQWWRYGCVMRSGESEDRTLCDDDKNGFQWLYGES